MPARRKVVILGAGAAGLMAAARGASLGAEVTVLERNREPGRKLLLSGHGRCNVTHEGDVPALVQSIPGNGRFLYSALASFGPELLRAHLLRLGVPTKVERGNRVFPESDRAETVRDALVRDAVAQGASFSFEERVTELIVSRAPGSGAGPRVEGVIAAGGRRHPAGAVIVATGGLAYPGTGSTGDGHGFARAAGHRIVPPFPSLVPLVCSEDWVSRIAGLSLRNVTLTAYRPGDPASRPLAREHGEMLFTHFGLSGPIVLRASRAISHALATEGLDAVAVRVDLKPALSPEVLDQRVQRDFAAASNREFRNSLGGLLPSSLIEPVVELSAIDPQKRVREVTRPERLGLVALLKGLSMTVTATRGFGEAIVTAGGVDTREVNPATMESRLAAGLFFAGEVLDVDGFTGGFNLQIAFSTGWVAGGAAAAAAASDQREDIP
ncbi:MAG: NAD(P)/FAD-dependent oxidoreductase [Bacillota bacterium]|nr:NAD(P)/FAD-dependent oxidoreductase [Bacillota bacterium]